MALTLILGIFRLKPTHSSLIVYCNHSNAVQYSPALIINNLKNKYKKQGTFSHKLD
jgi:hypothetical protein